MRQDIGGEGLYNRLCNSVSAPMALWLRAGCKYKWQDIIRQPDSGSMGGWEEGRCYNVQNKQSTHLNKPKGEINRTVILILDFNNPLRVYDKTKKAIKKLNNTIK